MKYVLSFMLIVYGANWCGYCHEQLNELERLGIPYTYIDVDREKHPEIHGLPTLKNDRGQINKGVLTGKELTEFVGA